MNLMSEDETQKYCRKKLSTRRRSMVYLGLIALASAFWLLFRSLRKPSRLSYPCQQTALSNIHIFSASILAMIPSAAMVKSAIRSAKPALVMGILLLGSSFIASDGFTSNPFTISEVRRSVAPVPLAIDGQLATTPDPSEDPNLSAFTINLGTGDITP